jgi:hypothetical protein
MLRAWLDVDYASLACPIERLKNYAAMKLSGRQNEMRGITDGNNFV